YSIITGAQPPVDSINSTWAETYGVDDNQEPNFVMKDLRGEAPVARVSETYATYTGFTAPGNTGVWQRIDFLFGGSNGQWNAQAYAVDDARCDDGMLMSDHRPTVLYVVVNTSNGHIETPYSVFTTQAWLTTKE
ncbi:hypothetical protein CPB85DRAFT_1261358, partial [Mucidula mucida]